MGYSVPRDGGGESEEKGWVVVLLNEGVGYWSWGKDN